jgi:LysR family transcriptional regulator, low CO2-responsive transcriptional regulator
MTPTQARAFLAVALKGSFSEAARSLGVSQPTVTYQIKEIERKHEVELFYRSGRGASLSQVGQSLLPYIQRMFGSFEEAGTYLDDIQGMHRGHIRIGSYGPYDVMRLVARYSSQFPTVSISVDFSNSQSLTEKLLRYELDIAVLGSIKKQPEFYALPFSNPPLIVIAPRIPPWTGRYSVSASDLNKQTIVRREPGSAARAAHDRLFAQAKISPSRIIQCAGRDGVVSAVAAGIGVGTIFDEGILPDDRVIKLKIPGPAIHSKVDIVCLADRKSNKLISSFLKIAQAMLKEQKRTHPKENKILK